MGGTACKIGQAGDSSWCDTCGLKWDTNDPVSPVCPRPETTDWPTVTSPATAPDEIERMARETARDAYRATLALLQGTGRNVAMFGVQHVGGRIMLTIEVMP